MNSPRSAAATRRWRLLGLLPIGFVGWAYATYDHPAHLLWLCNVCNLLLAVALLTDNLRLLWVATLWLVLGTPLWVMDIFVKDRFYPHSVFTHVVAPVLGLVAVRGRAAPAWTWILAVALGLAAQAVCRLWTPPALNINVSHATYRAMTGWFDSYIVYWLLVVLAISAVHYTSQRMITRLLAPVKKPDQNGDRPVRAVQRGPAR